MTTNNNPISITSNSSLNFSDNVCIITPGANTTITLPLIVCDGSKFIMIRQDKNTTIAVIVTRTSPNVIYDIFGSSVTSINLLVSTTTEFLSYEGNWYISESISSVGSNLGSFLSGTYTSNSTNPWLVLSAGTSLTDTSLSSNFVPTIFTVVVNNISVTNPLYQAEFSIRQPYQSNSYLIISILGSNLGAVGSFSIHNLSSYISIPPQNIQLSIIFNRIVGANNDKIGLCSVRLA